MPQGQSSNIMVLPQKRLTVHPLPRRLVQRIRQRPEGGRERRLADGAGAALGDAAAVLGTDEVEVVTQHPEHGSGRVNVHLLLFAVDVECEVCHDGDG